MQMYSTCCADAVARIRPLLYRPAGMVCSRFNNSAPVRMLRTRECETLSPTRKCVYNLYLSVWCSRWDVEMLRVESMQEDLEEEETSFVPEETCPKRGWSVFWKCACTERWECWKCSLHSRTQNNCDRIYHIYIGYYARDSDHKMHSITRFLWPTTMTNGNARTDATRGGHGHSLLSFSSVGRLQYCMLQRSTNCAWYDMDVYMFCAIYC